MNPSLPTNGKAILDSENLFWDSCVFIRYFVGDPSAAHFDDICRFIEEAKAGKRKILFSTITLAEFKEQHFKTSEFGTFSEFLEEMGTACLPVEPNPNVMIQCSQLRSATPVDPGRPSVKTKRVISTPDAIMLMTAVYAKEALGIDDLVVHSTDEGKGVTWAGRCIPIIGFEDWFPEKARSPVVSAACGLNRSKPIHPEPRLTGIVVHGRFNTQSGHPA